MLRVYVLVLSCLLPCATPVAHAAQPEGQSPLADATVLASSFPEETWQHSAPSSFGFNQAQLDLAISFAQSKGSTSGMVVSHGVVIAEWGDTARRSNLHSARKSFLSALIGIAVSRGQIHLDDSLETLGIDDNDPALSAEEKQATVRMLIEARSGVYHPTVYETNAMQAAKPARYSHAPGTFWYYNNWDFNTLGAIYAKASGNDIFEALKTEIAAPIGMQDYRVSDGHYVSGGSDSRYPAYPFDLSARDLARFALLYLHGGQWRDRQIVPRDWVEASTRSYSDTPTGGYGYMWWTSVPAGGERGRDVKLLRPTFWADGHLGQYAVVVPSLDLVVVNRVDGKLTNRQMHQKDMEELMWLVENAAGAAGIGAEPR
jgi:CubicO group peptidase (beta-lactamase class C family)